MHEQITSQKAMSIASGGGLQLGVVFRVAVRRKGTSVAQGYVPSESDRSTA